MAQTETAAATRLPNVFTLKYVLSDSRLLSLPRELRDMIYEHTLIEPRRWDKRHARTCTFYNLETPAEIPPYRVSELDSSPFWSNGHPVPICNIHKGEDMCYRQTCNRMCLQRRGLALLRTSKQILREASPIFWNNFVACFDDVDILVAVFNSLPTSAIHKIRKVSLMALRRVNGHQIENRPLDWRFRFAFLDIQKALSNTLNQMANLDDLELPAEYFDVLKHQYISFSRLRYLHCITQEIIWYSSDRMTILLDVGLSKRIDICAHENNVRHRCCPYRIYCRTCTDFYTGLADEGGRLVGAKTMDGVLWDDAVTFELQRRQPAQGPKARYTVSVRLSDGANYQMKVWGLPVNDFKARDRELLRQILLVEDRVTPRTHPTIRFVSIADDCIDKFEASKRRDDSSRRDELSAQQKEKWTLTMQRHGEKKRRELRCAAARRDKYERAGRGLTSDSCG